MSFVINVNVSVSVIQFWFGCGVGLCVFDSRSYFLESEFYNTSKTCLKSCQTCAIAINKLIIRCRNIKEAQIEGTPLEQFDDLQPKILSALHAQIQAAIVDIQDQQLILDASFVKLSHKHKALIDSCKEIDFTVNTRLITGTPFQPPLKQILEFVSDALTYGSQIHSQIETSLKILELKRLGSEPLVENLKVPAYWEKKIFLILAYTSFCTENEI